MSADGLLARTEACLEAVRRHDPGLRAMISVNPAARAEAEAAGAGLARGALPGAGGLVVSVKDNIDTAGLRTTMGSAFFAEHVPNRDAPVVARLRRAGCVVIGKANLHEFAFGGTTQNPHHGLGRNPWDMDRIPGGSSGGSGASVAAGMCDVSLGTDTGGSIRLPAALNGVVGLRPTHGRVPNTGCFPVSAAHDTIGPLARTVAQAAAVYEVIAGHDPGDETSRDRPVQSWANAFARGIAGLRLGVPEAWLADDLHPEVEARLREALSVLERLGVRRVRLDLPPAGSLQAPAMALVHADAAAVHAERLATRPEVFGADVLERLRLGEAVTGPGYAAALRTKERWRSRMEGVFGGVDLLFSPAVPVPAPRAADSARTIATTRGITRFTYAWSMIGVPALVLPCGFTAAGLPVGLQLVAPPWEEARLLALGAHYQDATDHHLRRPVLPAAA